MSAPSVPDVAARVAPLPLATFQRPRHSLVDDLLGMLTGTAVAAFGLLLLRTSSAVTGGTAGLALLFSYATNGPFAVLFFAVNMPFFALALWKKGWSFTLRTMIAVAMVSAFTALQPHVITIERLNPVYGVLLGNLMAGVGVLILFRHQASLGGFNILVLLLQERLGWRAGYVQMVLDMIVVLTAFTVVAPHNVLLSAAGVVVLNLVLAINHRPGRYMGT